ncbi:MAG: serine/threonine protein kinase, partial [Myxococcales bacterium]|nr:serine/threonine protein kinase [Myxococcales bacterium]
MPLPVPGDVVDSKYAIVRTVGRGGMGIVYEARHLKLQQRVAIKFLKEELVGNAESIARFDREARAAARLSSPHAARIYDVDATPDGVPFIVMEYLEGHDLAAELVQRGGTLPIDEAVDWILQACSAMAEAHAASIVHRDLKPSNLFACESASGGAVVKVLDFGISKITVDLDENLTSNTTVLGTPHYMSPEQVTAGGVDGRSDIWALSVILYRAITGQFPFQAPNATALAVAIATEPPVPILERAPTLPAPLAGAIMQGIAKAKDARHPTVRALAQAIAPFGSGRFAAPAQAPAAARSSPRMHLDLPAAPTPAASAASAAEEMAETRSTWGKTEPGAPRGRGRVVAAALALGLGLGLVGTLGFAGVRHLRGSAASDSAGAASAIASPPAVAASAAS